MATIKPLYLRSDGLRIMQAGVGDVIDHRLVNAPDGVATYGSATLTFGIAPGTTETSIAVTGISSITSNADIMAWISADDSTGDHTAFDHMYASGLISFTCGTITPGVGFVIYARALENMIGSFKVRYSWVDSSQSEPGAAWVRPAEWVALPDVTGQQMATGVLAVYPESNFVAVSCTGNYYVDWGTGAGPTAVSSGVTAETNITHSSISPSTDVGLAAEAAVTFTAATDTVNLTAHGFVEGQLVGFSSIVTTTGITAHTSYRVINPTANTFQLTDYAWSSFPTPIPLTTDGSGYVYPQIYRQAVVKLTPNGGSLTSVNFNIKHSALVSAGTSTPTVGWLDIAIAGTSLTAITISAATPNVFYRDLQRVRFVGSMGVTSLEYMFLGCNNLRVVSIDDSVGVTAYQGMFNSCSRLVLAPELDTSACSNFAGMFANCYNLTSIPAYDFSNGTNLASCFVECHQLKAIPSTLDFTSMTTAESMFENCRSLAHAKLTTSSALTNMTQAFSYCRSLRSVEVTNTSGITTLYGAFYNCAMLTSITLGSLVACADFSGAFSFTPITETPVIDTAASNVLFDQTFEGCMQLTSVSLNFANAISAGAMFNLCSALRSLTLENASTSLDTTAMFSGCKLKELVIRGLVVDIDISDMLMSGDALDRFYSGLGTVTTKSVTVSSNWGVATHFDGIATIKGWTVVV